VDRNRPQSFGRVDVRVAVRPARDPGRRVGLLMFNPGGPGAGAADIVARSDWASFYFPPGLLDRFDIVGVDPRGVPGSASVSCTRPAHDPAVSRFPYTRDGVRRLTRANASFARSCRDATGALAAHLDTETVARDFDAVRAALGEPRVSLLGISYGTMLAQAYAERYPDRLRAVVLDGVVDRSLPAARLVLDGAAAVQDGLTRFAARCRASADCALKDRDLPAELNLLYDRAGRGEVRALGRNVTAEELRLAVNDGLNSPLADTALATGIRDAADHGDASTLAALARYTTPDYARYRAIICQDVPRARPGALIRLGRAAARRGPRLRGTSEFWDIVSGCAGWPEPVRWTPHGWRVPPAVTPLILSGAHDVATPRAWAESVHRRLPGSVLVRWDGDGHAALPMHNRCAMRAAVAYLTDLTRPAATTCPADPPAAAPATS
jgi:pimeloyl-ACP methyl ester carboxylesterase